MRAIRNPRSVVGELYRVGERVNQLIVNHDGFDPVTEDWDVLLILDACRVDAYESVVGSTVDDRISPGTNSWSYYESAFDGRELHDTVLVTANPHATDIQPGTFHAIDHVWSSDWDGARETVLPETMADVVTDAAETYPDKRIIGHWMQPHTPHLGEKAEELVERHLGCHPTTSTNMAGFGMRCGTMNWTEPTPGRHTSRHWSEHTRAFDGSLTVSRGRSWSRQTTGSCSVNASVRCRSVGTDTHRTSGRRT